MTQIQYDKQDAAMQSELRRVDKTIRALADHVPTGLTLGDGDRLQMEAIESSDILT